MFIRISNLKTLVDDFVQDTPKDLPKSVRDAMDHGLSYAPVAKELYTNVMKYHLYHTTFVRETGCVIQPELPWLLASPDGLIVDHSEAKTGLIEIKCPKSKRECCLADLLKDESFYIKKTSEGDIVLDKKHSYGYYTQIQMAMGVCGAKFCDFIVFTFKTIVILRTPFDEEYFSKLVGKLNLFYEKHLLKKIKGISTEA